MTSDPVELIAETARRAGRKVKRTHDGYMISCPGPSHAHGDRNPSLHVTHGRAGDAVLTCHTGCEREAVVEAFGLTMADLFASTTPKSEHPPVDLAWLAATYSYVDEHGVELYQRERIEHFPRKAKTFAYRHRVGNGYAPGRGDHEPVLYNLPAVKATAAARGEIHACEGEKDAISLCNLGLVATTAGAVGDWKDEYACHFVGARGIVIHADNDTPGRKLARRVEAACRALDIPTRVLVSPFGKDVTDHLELGHGLDELEILEDDEPAVEGEHARFSVRTYNEIAMLRATWLYKGLIPQKALTLLAGEPGVGKSTIALDIAAQITLGTLPGEDFGRPRDVLIVATEDLAEYTIKPRLAAAGADMGRVLDLVMHETGTTLELPDDLPNLETIMTDHNVALVILDPLTSRIGKGLDTHRDSDVRKALEPLAGIGNRLNVAVLGIIHLNKAGNTDPLRAVMGSVAFGAVARSVLFAMEDPNQEGRHLFGLAKSNLGPMDVPTMTYTFDAVTVAETDAGPIVISRVAWGDDAEISIRAAMQVSSEDKSAIEAASEWLRDELDYEGGSVLVVKAMADGRKAGHADRTLRRARERVGAEVHKVGFPPVTSWRWPGAPSGVAK